MRSGRRTIYLLVVNPTPCDDVWLTRLELAEYQFRVCRSATEALTAAANEPFDAILVGGGITGAGYDQLCLRLRWELKGAVPPMLHLPALGEEDSVGANTESDGSSPHLRGTSIN